MTLRRRLALVAAVAVAVAIALASGIVYVVVRGELRGRLDDQLRLAADPRVALRLAPDRPAAPPPAAGGTVLGGRRGGGALGGGGGVGTLGGGGGLGGAGIAGPGGAGMPGPGGGFLPQLLRRRLAAPRDALGLETAYVAVVDTEGARLFPAGDDDAADLPATAATKAVADGTRAAFFSDAEIDGTAVRVYTAPVAGAELALQVARPLTDVDRTLDRLALVLALVSAGGIALAAALGRVVARTALRPVAQLTRAVEHVGATGDLSRRIGERDDAVGEDEIARLARSFDAMLSALEASVGRQRQLVADASHELRTPLTSIRTNIEVLKRPDGFAEPERRRLLDDVVEQLEELSGLVSDLVELAREQEPPADLEDVRLDLLVADAVGRAQRRARAPRFQARLQPCLVHGVPARLDRAVANLLDNAAKWSPPGAEVTVELTGEGELRVRDRGPGIAHEDLPHVFERFYRAPGARGLPGSGLGLAIVRQVAELHGGTVTAATAADGGALLRLLLPGSVVIDASPHP